MKRRGFTLVELMIVLGDYRVKMEHVCRITAAATAPVATARWSLPTASTSATASTRPAPDRRSGATASPIQPYTFLATSVKVHAIPDKAQAKGFELKAGMQIRFNSSIDLFSKQNQVREILATNMID